MTARPRSVSAPGLADRPLRLVGQFDRLTVVALLGRDERGRPTVGVRCDCGRHEVRTRYEVAAGEAVCCRPCSVDYHPQRPLSSRARPLAMGERFGSWTIIASGGRRSASGGRAQWCTAVCDCGRVVWHQRTDKVVNGRSKRCMSCNGRASRAHVPPGPRPTGATRWPASARPHIGDQLGEWTVLARGVKASSRGRTLRVVVAVCKCGRVRVHAPHNLTGGRSKQCRSCSSAEQVPLMLAARGIEWRAA